MAIQIEDVAKESGVSISTVSRVMNRPHLVNAKTRERVEEAIQKLAYQPNAHAQGLMSGRSDIPNLGARPRRDSKLPIPTYATKP